jgi:hypothetical protein
MVKRPIILYQKKYSLIKEKKNIKIRMIKKFNSTIYLLLGLLLPRTQSIHQTSGFGIPSIFLLTSIQTDKSELQFLHVPS